jgi:hypothetical protein
MSQPILRSLVVVASLLLGALATAGCSSTTTGSNEPGSSGTSDPTPGNSLAGTYKGAYQGDATGAVRMTIGGDDIDVVANVGGKDYAASGVLADNGGVSVGIGTGDGVVVTFEGTFTSTGGSGTWRSSVATKGTWSVSR